MLGGLNESLECLKRSKQHKPIDIRRLFGIILFYFFVTNNESMFGYVVFKNIFSKT